LDCRADNAASTVELALDLAYGETVTKDKSSPRGFFDMMTVSVIICCIIIDTNINLEPPSCRRPLLGWRFWSKAPWSQKSEECQGFRRG
jgi:hypothetical protein